MRVMVVEADRDDASRAVQKLEAAGHEVLRCHEQGLGPFPCNGLMDPASCPLAVGVDVALTVRRVPWRTPTPSEDGALCAVRAGAPLVVTGTTQVNPFAPWAEATVDEMDVVAGCEHAAMTGYRQAVAAVRNALRSVDSDAGVSVVRAANGLRVVLDLAAGVDGHRAAVAAVAAVRRTLPHVATIDVSVRDQVAS
jgi:hypothetical protein